MKPQDENYEEDILKLISLQPLTTDHVLSIQKEAKRIQKSGGDVRPAPFNSSKSPRD